MRVECYLSGYSESSFRRAMHTTGSGRTLENVFLACETIARQLCDSYANCQPGLRPVQMFPQVNNVFQSQIPLRSELLLEV